MAYGSAPRRSRLKIGNCLILVAAIGAIGYIWWTRNHSASPTTSDTSRTAGRNGGEGKQSESDREKLAGGDSTSPNPPMQEGDLLYLYDRSAEKWLKPLVDSFNDKNSGAKIAIKWSGSREAKQDILYDKQRPALWTPADMYWIDKLNLDWHNVGKKSDDIIPEAKPILNSLLVFIMRPDRAKVFQAAMARSEYKGRTWKLMYDLSTKGWSAAGGPADWGQVKIVQTDATKSNSGQAALALMFAEYRSSHPDATEADPGFLNWMRAIEGRVRTFQETTSKVIEAFQSGGSSEADIAIAYESNALTAVDTSGGNVRVIYPEPTVVIEFPVGTVRADWVTQSQRETAAKFQEALLSSDAQRKALEYGFRPVSESLRGAVDTAFSRGSRSEAGFRLDVKTVTRPVSTKVIDGLIYVWDKSFGSGKR